VTFTLLFDLDDTLLGNDMDQFLPAYLQALSAHMAPYADPRLLVKSLLSASAGMLENLRPDLTLEEVFDSGFYPPLGFKKEQVRHVLDSFYADEFPKLRRLTQFRPQAVNLVKTALARGYRVAIATNALFPSTAIRQRLAWAGLPPDEIPFALLPSFHTFHFAKPNPAYFAELMAKLAWPEGPIVMVGNSLTDDMIAANQVGLATFWVTQNDASTPDNQFQPNGHGALADFIPWLDSVNPDSLLPNFMMPSAILATLRSTPALLYSQCASLSSEAWTRHPIAGEWSAIEILCHLLDTDTEVNLPRLRKTFQETNPFIAGIDTDAWADARHYIQRDCLQALKDFVTARLELISFLESLSPDDWQHPARHAVFGPISLQEMAIFAASHDRLHVRQVFQTIQTYEPI